MKNKKKGSFGAKMKRALSNLKLSHFIILIVLLLVVVCASTIGTVVVAATSGMPSLDNNDITDYDVTSYIVDKDGAFVEKMADNVNYVDVETNEISQNMLNAVTSIEDKRFYDHHGVDPIRIMGAMAANIKAGETVQGGSTITQQLAGLALLDRSEKTYKRKIQEAILALRIEHQYSKDEILTAYLNRCYFGVGYSGMACYGIEAAANDILGKHASDLTVADAALLAGMIQNPSRWSPISDPESAKERRDTVLKAMLDNDVITEDEYNQYVNEEIVTASITQADDNQKQSYNQSYIDATIEEALKILELEDDPSQLYSGGYIIHTGLDQDLQSYMYDYFESDYNFPSSASYEEMQAAMVVLNTDTSLVAGMIGGRHLDEGQERGFNRATQAKRQPGSTFKPLFVYGPAFEEAGMSPSTVYLDAKYTIWGHTIENADLKYHGNVTIRYALEQSLNTVAARVLNDIGPETGLEFAKKCGITTLKEDDGDGITDATISAGLGGLTYGVTPLEMAGAYAAIAHDGIYTKPHTITKITNEEGDIIWEEEPESHRAMSEETSYLLTSCLQSVITNGIGSHAAIYDGRPTAGKTGTTDNSKDLWFCGFTPQYTAAVWIGNDTPATIYSTSDSAAYVFANIMSYAHSGLDVEYFDVPDGVTEVTVDSSNGLLATQGTASSNRSTEVYASGTEPTTYSSNNYNSNTNNTYNSGSYGTTDNNGYYNSGTNTNNSYNSGTDNNGYYNSGTNTNNNYNSGTTNNGYN